MLKAKLDREFERKSVTLKNREAKLNEHLKATGLLPDNSRVRVDGFGKSVSQKAVWANRKQTIAENNGSKPITTITDAAIGKVRFVEIHGYSSEQNTYIQNQHMELLRTSRDKNNSNEIAFIISNGCKREAIAFGVDDRLDFTSPDCINALTYMNNLTVLHNHPRNGSFSSTDIIFFMQHDNVKSFSIVKNNGAVEILTKAENYDMLVLKRDFERIIKKTVKSGSNSEYDTAIRKLLEKHSQKGGMLEWKK